MSRGEMMSVAAKVELQLKIKDVIAYLSAYWMQKYSSMAPPCRADLKPRLFSKTSIWPAEETTGRRVGTVGND